MNRQKKIQKLHDKRLKRARAKLKTSSKEPYVSKSDRAKAESEKLERSLQNSTAESDTEKE